MVYNGECLSQCPSGTSYIYGNGVAQTVTCSIHSSGNYRLSVGSSRAKHGWCGVIDMQITPPTGDAISLNAAGATNAGGGHNYNSSTGEYSYQLPAGTAITVLTSGTERAGYCTYIYSINH